MSLKTLNDLEYEMQKDGLIISVSDMKINGAIQRCPTINKPRSKNGWYVIYENGDFIKAVYGDNQLQNKIKWSNWDKNNSYRAKKAFSTAKAREEAKSFANNINIDHQEKEQEKAKQRKVISESYSKARILLKINIPIYITNKGIGELLNMSMQYPLKIDAHNNLLIGLFNIDDILTGYQVIYADGNKIFASGTIKKGSFYTIIADELNIASCDQIYIGEGFATMASMYIALNEAFGTVSYCCIVAFDCGNLESVLLAIWNRYRKEIILVADNDCASNVNTGHNTCNNLKEKYRNISINIFLPTYND